MKVFALLLAVAGIAHCASLSTQIMSQANSAIMGNASYVLGWQLAASQQSEASVQMSCKNITWLGNGRWAAVGLMPAYIQEPFCEAKDSVPDPSTALLHINACSTEIFVTQLLHAFGSDSSSHMTWLCSNFDHSAMDSFNLNSHRIANAICASESKVYARTNTTITVNPDFTNLTSHMFAKQYALSAPTAVDRLVLCTQYDYVALLQSREGIDSSVVRATVCDTTDPVMGTDLADQYLRLYRSELFGLELLASIGADEDRDKKEYLCRNLEVDDLEQFGMISSVVQDMVCD